MCPRRVTCRFVSVGLHYQFLTNAVGLVQIRFRHPLIKMQLVLTWCSTITHQSFSKSVGPDQWNLWRFWLFNVLRQSRCPIKVSVLYMYIVVFDLYLVQSLLTGFDGKSMSRQSLLWSILLSGTSQQNNIGNAWPIAFSAGLIAAKPGVKKDNRFWHSLLEIKLIFWWKFVTEDQ